MLAGTQSTDPNGIFYGWWIVLAGTAVLFVSSGIGFYGHGVILDPLRARHGWSKGTISLAITLFFLTAGVMGMIVGRQIDKFGPRSLLVIGSTIVGLGLLLLSRISQLWHLYAVYFLMSLGWSCSSVLVISTLITNWFISKRGVAMGLTMTGLSIGGVVLVPFASYLISRWGLKVALPVLGATFWAVIIPTALFLIRQRPSDLGLFPDGEAPLALQENGLSRPRGYDSQMRAWSRRQVIRTLPFWSIVVAFLLALGSQIAFLMHEVSFLSQFLGQTGAALGVSFTAGASVIGRLFLGPIADRYDKRYVAGACFVFQGSAVLFLAYSSEVVALYLGTFAFGLTMGGILMMQTLIIGECFGLISFGTVSGLTGMFSVSGAALGPAVAGLIYDATQSYQMAFTIFAVASAAATLPVLLAKPPRSEVATME